MIQHFKQVDGLDVSFACKAPCHGQSRIFGKKCSNCVKKFLRERSKGDKVVVPVVGAGIHIFKAFKGQVDQRIQVDLTIEQFQLFADAMENIIFNSPPSYEISKVPEEYQNATKGTAAYYWFFLPHVAKYKIQYLDFFQLTRSCAMANCTEDGGHRGRFVNRWKAQLLLNTLCSYETE
jgi:hypothetical protein